MRVCLNHDSVYFRETVEVGHILTAIITGQCAQYRIRCNACAFTLGCIHLYRPLRIAHVERRICHRNFRTLVQCSQILLGSGKEFVDITAHLILHMEFQRITHTVTRNHTRRNSEDTGILDIGRTTVHLTDDCLHIILIIRTFVPRLQFQNQHTERASLSCQQSVAGHFLHVLNLRNIHQTLFDAFHHFVGRSQRTTGRRTYIDEYHTLVFVRHQTGLCCVHQEYKQHYRANEQRPCQPSAFDKDQYHILVFLYQNIESRVECFTETCRKVILLRTVFIDIRLQQQRT